MSYASEDPSAATAGPAPPIAPTAASDPVAEERRGAAILLGYLAKHGSGEAASPDPRQLGEFAAIILDRDLNVAKATEVFATLSAAAAPASVESIEYSQRMEAMRIVGFGTQLVMLVGALMALLYLYMFLGLEALQAFHPSSDTSGSDTHQVPALLVLPFFRSADVPAGMRLQATVLSAVLSGLFGYLGAYAARLQRIATAIFTQTLTAQMTSASRPGPVLGAIGGLIVYLLWRTAAPNYPDAIWPFLLANAVGVSLGWAVGRPLLFSWSFSRPSFAISPRRFVTGEFGLAGDLLTRPFEPRLHLLMGVALAAAVVVSFALSAGLAPPFASAMSILGTGQKGLVVLTASCGAIGAWVHITAAVFSDVSSGGPAEGRTRNRRTVLPSVRLAIGAFTGFAGALLVPMAVISGDGQNANLSPPTIALLALAVGYGAAKLLDGLATKIEGLGHVDAEIVEAGIKRAFAARTPVNYNGFVKVRLLTDSAQSALQDGRASLHAGRPYRLMVTLTSSDSAPAQQGVLSQSVVIDGGSAAEKVPMTLRVDFGFIDLPPEQRSIEVPATGTSKDEPFEFTVPDLKDDSEISLSPITMTVAVYQYDLLYRSCSLPVSLMKP